MLSLFIDTTNHVTVGLLGETCEWLEYEEFKGLKGSAYIHYKIDLFLKNQNKKAKDITQIFYVAGPGSYTGMRVAEGIKQVFNWSGVKSNSFYHFQVPYLLGIKSGSWCCDAFKKEFFEYSWDEKKSRMKLIKENELQSSFYSFGDNVSDENSTALMIRHSSKTLFTRVLKENLMEDLYYFRSLQEEFGGKGA